MPSLLTFFIHTKYYNEAIKNLLKTILFAFTQRGRAVTSILAPFHYAKDIRSIPHAFTFDMEKSELNKEIFF